MENEKVIAYCGRNFSISLKSMLGSTNYGWALAHLPEGIVLTGTDIVALSQRIGPVNQIFNFGVTLEKTESTVDIVIPFILVNYSDFTQISENVSINVSINNYEGTESRDRKFVAYHENTAQYNGNQQNYYIDSTALLYGMVPNNSCVSAGQTMNLKYGYPCGMQDANVKYGYPCGMQNAALMYGMYYGRGPLVKYGFACGAQDPLVKYGSPCGVQDPLVKYGSPCGVQDPLVKYGSPCGAQDANLKYGYPCGVQDANLKYGYPCGVQDANLKYGYPCGVQDANLKYGYPCGVQDANLKYGYPCAAQDPCTDYGFPECNAN